MAACGMADRDLAIIDHQYAGRAPIYRHRGDILGLSHIVLKLSFGDSDFLVWVGRVAGGTADGNLLGTHGAGRQQANTKNQNRCYQFDSSFARIIHLTFLCK